MTNPVHWAPWGDEAWKRAKEEQKLVIVSIGYSSCHWCHVMEKETFMNMEAATLMNRRFVCIKVDREERPDVDHVYMDALQLMSGQGGWPLNCVTLPDGSPIWGSTYLSLDRWMAALTAVDDVWTSEPERTKSYAKQVVAAVQALGEAPPPLVEKPGEAVERGIDLWMESGLKEWQKKWDPTHGGTQGAPKFPLPVQLDGLMRLENEAGKRHVKKTLLAMCRGGIHDHVGGGFSRYSVDHRWHVPHFEKMLYDNAQLLSTLTLAYQEHKHPAMKDAAEKCAGLVLREWSHTSGGFCSALDADSDGTEGAYYVWREADLKEALTDVEEREEFQRVFGIGASSLWEQGRNVLSRTAEADRAFWRDAPLQDRMNGALEKLKAWRNGKDAMRSKPGLDDKILTSWTALAISGFAKAGMRLARPNWVRRAVQGGNFLKHVARDPHHPERLLRNWQPNGESTCEGFAEDYAFAIEALLDLHQCTLDPVWKVEARALMATALDRFFDPNEKVFFFNASDAKELFARKRVADDSVLPSPNATFAACLWRLGWSVDIPAWRHLAREMTVRHLGTNPPLESSTKWLQTWVDITQPFALVSVQASNELGVQAALQSWWQEPRPGSWIEASWPGASPVPTWATADSKHAPALEWRICVDGTCGLPSASVDMAWSQFQSAHRT